MAVRAVTHAPLPSRTYSVSIDRDWRAVYEMIWRPEFFGRWASGLSDSQPWPDGDGWTTEGPDGPVRLRFTPHNDHGVMDHWVEPADVPAIHVPLRVVANGRGAEVMLTLYRQPDMTDEKFAADAKWISRDLARLRSVVLSG